MGQEIKLTLGIICGLILFIKIKLHQYVDRKNNYMKKSSTAYRVNPVLLLPYLNNVSLETKKYKVICNTLWTVFIFLILLLIFC